MTQHDPRPPIASTLALLTGNAILFGSLLLTLVFPQLHLGLAVAFGAMLGTPFFVLGFRLQSQSNPGDGTSKPFLPTRTEARRVFRGLVAFAIFLACFYGPLALVVLTGYILPAGDNWRVVTIRLSFVVLAACSWYSLVRFISKTTPNWFRGRLPDKTLHTLTWGTDRTAGIRSCSSSELLAPASDCNCGVLHCYRGYRL
jgi:hypothetical protein